MTSVESKTKPETPAMNLETQSLSSFDVFAYRPDELGQIKMFNLFKKAIAVAIIIAIAFSFTLQNPSYAASPEKAESPTTEESIVPPPRRPLESRPDGCFDYYRLPYCNRALLVLTTRPPQPNAPVFGWRKRNGKVERNGTEIGRTNDLGQFINSAVLERGRDEGEYTDEQFAVGSRTNQKSKPLEYVVKFDPIP